MRKSNFLYVAAAALSLSFAACSQEDIPGGDVITPDMATSYAKVKICMPKGVGTRANFDNPQFDYGKPEEAAVKSVKLVLYSEDGQAVGVGAPIQLDNLTHQTEQNQNVSDYGDVIFKFNLTNGAPVPTKVLAYVNTETESFNLDEINKESTHNTINSNELFKGDKSSATDFVMTNSGYYDEVNDNAYVVAAKLEEGVLAPTPETAKKKVTIYVERLAAKITVSEKPGITEEDKKADVIVKDIEGNPYTFTFKSQNWGVTGTAKSMYLFKKKFTFNSENDSWMNYQDGFRSFWAEGVNFNTPYQTGYVKEGKTSTDILNYIAYKDVTTAFGSNDYAPEHTYDFNTLVQEKGFNPLVPSTSAIVVGHYVLAGKNADEWFKDVAKSTEGDTRYDFYLRYVGVENGKPSYIIYNKSQLIAYLLNELNGVSKLYFEPFADSYGPEVNKYGWEYKDEEPVDLTYYLTVEKDENGKYKLAWASKERENEIGAGEEFDEVEDDQLFGKDYPCDKTTFSMHYNHGLAYFQVAIEHNSEVGNKNGKYGVVRNHSYNLTVNKYVGLGGHLDEDNTDNKEDQPIIPEPEVTTAYINATINVLSWHSINQTVEF